MLGAPIIEEVEAFPRLNERGSIEAALLDH
jgi:hypothetical protein